MRSKRRDSEEYWISVSDLMAGLMMVFLFIMIIYASNSAEYARQSAENARQSDKNARILAEIIRTSDEKLYFTRKIINEYNETENAIYSALNDKFKDDLDRWKAKIDRKTLTVRFDSPDILFEAGEAKIPTQFKTILDEFIPDYMQLLHEDFEEKIDEIRIEGHTSSEWKGSTDTKGNTDTLEAFIENMKLSQARTRSVLEYSLSLPEIQNLTPWMTKTVSANGMSSARLRFDKATGLENKDKSRRVEFSIRTKAKDAIFKLIKEFDLNDEEVSQ